MCGGGKGGTQSTQSTNQNVAYTPYGLPLLQDIYNRASEAAKQPYQPYTGQLTAGLSGAQQSGIQQILGAQGQADPFINTASGEMGQAYNLINSGAGLTGQGQGLIDQGSLAAQQGYNQMLQGAGTANQAQNYYTQAAGLGTGATGIIDQGRNLIGGSQGLIGSGSLAAQQGFNQLQNAIGTTAQGQGLVGQGAGLVGGNAGPIGPGQIQQYMNPYQQQVINATMGNINETNAAQQQQVAGNAAMQGALGGDRAVVAQSELARQQGLASNQTLAGLNAQNYGQAVQTALAEQQAGMAGGMQLGSLGSQQANIGTQLGGLGSQQANIGSIMGNLGTQQTGMGSALGNLAGLQTNVGSLYGNLGGQQANLGTQLSGIGSQEANVGSLYNSFAGQMGNLGSQLSGQGTQLAGLGTQTGNLGLAKQNAALGAGQAALGAGGIEQQTQQAGLTAAYQQYLQQLAYPYQQAQFLANIGLPAIGAMGGLQTQIGQTGQQITPPQMSALQAFLGGGSLLLGGGMGKGTGGTGGGGGGQVMGNQIARGQVGANAQTGVMGNQIMGGGGGPGMPQDWTPGPNNQAGSFMIPRGTSNLSGVNYDQNRPIGPGVGGGDAGAGPPQQNRGGNIPRFQAGGKSPFDLNPWDVNAINFMGGAAPQMQIPNSKPTPAPMTPIISMPQQQSTLGELSKTGSNLKSLYDLGSNIKGKLFPTSTPGTPLSTGRAPIELSNTQSAAIPPLDTTGSYAGDFAATTPTTDLAVTAPDIAATNLGAAPATLTGAEAATGADAAALGLTDTAALLGGTDAALLDAGFAGAADLGIAAGADAAAAAGTAAAADAGGATFFADILPFLFANRGGAVQSFDDGGGVYPTPDAFNYQTSPYAMANVRGRVPQSQRLASPRVNYGTPMIPHPFLMNPWSHVKDTEGTAPNPYEQILELQQASRLINAMRNNTEATGGRVGYAMGGSPYLDVQGELAAQAAGSMPLAALDQAQLLQKARSNLTPLQQSMRMGFSAKGGRIGYDSGGGTDDYDFVPTPGVEGLPGGISIKTPDAPTREDRLSVTPQKIPDRVPQGLPQPPIVPIGREGQPPQPPIERPSRRVTEQSPQPPIDRPTLSWNQIMDPGMFKGSTPEHQSITDMAKNRDFWIRAGLGILGSPPAQGVGAALAHGFQGAISNYDQWSKDNLSAEQKAQELATKIKEHVDTYTQMTPYQQAHVGIMQEQLAQGRGQLVDYMDPKTGEIKAGIFDTRAKKLTDLEGNPANASRIVPRGYDQDMVLQREIHLYQQDHPGASPEQAEAAVRARRNQGVTSTPLNIPLKDGAPDPSLMRKGQVYNTRMGVRTWNGTDFGEE